jgi:hypothetical protein
LELFNWNLPLLQSNGGHWAGINYVLKVAAIILTIVLNMGMAVFCQFKTIRTERLAGAAPDTKAQINFWF